MTAAPDARPARGAGYVVAAVLALLLMLPVGVFYLSSGLVVPSPWVFVMWALFVAFAALAIWLARRRSWWVVAVPFVAAAVWWASVTAGEAVLGWTG